ncbi:Protein of unknown function [Micromonospora rhizosphaerae]|uniref:DUF2795 domain-containing protein n=1 Tax=Micromonospora rhizosphaerae TaxID=568872 RepID=A0A1C6SF31_9ACTN|nr:DUF2795 domain-containing protein [Micromonospora rhizosphaerae]SCL27988.1 Protein of unknown function [Micromonospora rhizosphaerae]
MATYSDVLQYLSALDYPAEKDDVVREAEREGAPQEVLQALRALPPGLYYENGNQVARSAGIDAAPEVNPSQRAAQARDRRQRVSQHLRGI